MILASRSFTARMHSRFRPGEPPAGNAQTVVGLARATSRERAMKVVVDYDLCEANAVCVDQAPEVFRVDENDNLHVLIENPSESLRKKVEASVRLCPRQAIS
ncbi:MAG: ferredoxin, partial [Myxococcota bacterium]